MNRSADLISDGTHNGFIIFAESHHFISHVRGTANCIAKRQKGARLVNAAYGVILIDAATSLDAIHHEWWRGQHVPHPAAQLLPRLDLPQRGWEVGVLLRREALKVERILSASAAIVVHFGIMVIGFFILATAAVAITVHWIFIGNMRRSVQRRYRPFSGRGRQNQ